MKTKIKILKHKLEKYWKEILRGTIVWLWISVWITAWVFSMYAVNWGWVSTATSWATLTANMWNATISALTGAVDTLDNVVVKVTWDQTIYWIKTFTGTIVAWKIGIWTSNPQSALDINGWIRLWNDTTPCTWTNAGTTRYNPTSKVLELCDWATWSSKISSWWTLPSCTDWEALLMDWWVWTCKNQALFWKEKINLVDYRSSMTVTWFPSDISSVYDSDENSYIHFDVAKYVYWSVSCWYTTPADPVELVSSIVIDMWSDYQTKIWNFVISWKLKISEWTAYGRKTVTDACAAWFWHWSYWSFKVFSSVDNSNFVEQAKITVNHNTVEDTENNFNLIWDIAWRYIKIETRRWLWWWCFTLWRIDIDLKDLQVYYNTF